MAEDRASAPGRASGAPGLIESVMSLPTQELREWQDDDYVTVTWIRRDQVLAVVRAAALSSPSVAESPAWLPIETLPKDRWVWVMFGNKNPEIAALRWNVRMSMWQCGTGYWTANLPFIGWSEMVMQPPSAPSPSAAAQKETP
jgi:hypothetical protein